nr:E3 ubiquitin-protein ligase UPL5 [Tanacetum cinerariifolium]
MLDGTSFIAVQDIWPFVDEFANKLSQGLVSSMETIGPSSTDVHDLNNFLRFMINAIIDPMVFDTLIPMHYNDNHPCYDQQVGYLYSLYLHIYAKLKACLTKMEDDIKFTNEEAIGPGVLREWFMLVCQAIFNLQNALFLTCLTDQRRFFPNPVYKVNPLHLEYYRFAGRVIALALMHNTQVGIVFGRAFFLQMARINVYLEDIKDADPYLYSSYIVGNEKNMKLFLKSLELEDLDGMLYGSESEIYVDDCKAHTEYNGYKETDHEIH